MALFIKAKDRGQNIIVIGWFTGEPSILSENKIYDGASAKYDYVSANDVISVQADGDELTYVLNRFSFIPACYGSKTMTWYGDFAKFIAGNL